MVSQKISCFKFLLHFIIISTAFLLSSCASNFGNRPDVQNFIQTVSQKDNFNPGDLTYLFNQVQPRSSSVHKENTAAEKTETWHHYKNTFLTSRRIQAGKNFWLNHQDALNKAQNIYGVDPAIIIGILGVETAYGKSMGDYRVMDALSTLAFNYPSRQTFFQFELEQYLLLTRELNKYPFDLKGSYAGAMGYPQFMPDNYRKLAVSYIPGQQPDLFNNPDDAILSIANYFNHYHWYPHKLAAAPVQKPSRNAVLFGDQYWRLYHNFDVIKRYNHSNYYAMAVFQLGQAVRKEMIRDQQRPHPQPPISQNTPANIPANTPQNIPENKQEN